MNRLHDWLICGSYVFKDLEFRLVVVGGGEVALEFRQYLQPKPQRRFAGHIPPSLTPPQTHTHPGFQRRRSNTDRDRCLLKRPPWKILPDVCKLQLTALVQIQTPHLSAWQSQGCKSCGFWHGWNWVLRAI